MSTILTSTDITDELIKPVVVADGTYLSRADEFIDDFIRSKDSTKTISDIASPVPYKVKQLMVAWVCFQVCLNKFGGMTGTHFKGEQGEDRWKTKLDIYRKLLGDYEVEMTLDILTGESTKGRGLYSVPLMRC